MPTSWLASDQRESELDRLAQAYVWTNASHEPDIAERLLTLLEREDDDDFDLDAWALQRVQGMRGDPERLASRSTFAMRVGPHVGLVIGQWWHHARRELITALQLHPGERQVFVEGGVEEVLHAELVDVVREEITAALARARFLGLDELAVQLLAQEALAASARHDYPALRAAAHDTPTLSDGDAIRPLVRVVGVELLGEFRVRLAFDDDVARTLDLHPFLRGPGLAAIRRPEFFIQLRLQDGTVRWPNGVALDAMALRYFPAVHPDGAEA